MAPSSSPRRRSAAIDVASTREQILAVAEGAFAEFGFHGVSLREILRQAEANVASGNYYFVSKHKLYYAVVERSLSPIQIERHARLEVYDAAPSTRQTLDGILGAYLGPHVRACATTSGLNYARIMARIGYEPPDIIEEIFAKLIAPTRRRWTDRLKRHFPDVDDEMFARGVAMVIAVMATLPTRFKYHVPRVNGLDDDILRLEDEVVRTAAGALVALLGSPTPTALP